MNPKEIKKPEKKGLPSSTYKSRRLSEEEIFKILQLYECRDIIDKSDKCVGCRKAKYEAHAIFKAGEEKLK